MRKRTVEAGWLDRLGTWVRHHGRVSTDDAIDQPVNNRNVN